MVLWNALEDLRRRENRKRGYLEVKTPLLYDIQTYITSGHYDNYRENMFFVQPHEGEEPLALKPMNCPGHMLLFGSQLRSYRDLPIRYAESSTLHRDERAGRCTASCASSTSPRTTRTSSSPRSRSRTRSTR